MEENGSIHGSLRHRKAKNDCLGFKQGRSKKFGVVYDYAVTLKTSERFDFFQRLTTFKLYIVEAVDDDKKEM